MRKFAKKAAALLLTAILTAGLVFPAAATNTAQKTTKADENRLPGDVSGDGQVKADDARLALRAAVGLERYPEGSPEFKAADADRDRVITAGDARMILRAAVGLEQLYISPEGDPSYWTKAEVVACFSLAMYATRFFAGNVTAEHTKEYSSFNVTKCPGGDIGRSLANEVVSGLLQPQTETLIYSGGYAKNSDGASVPLLLPETGNFTLPVEGVAAASAAEVGGKLKVRMTLVPESVSGAQVPPYNAGAVWYLNAGNLDTSIVRLDFSVIRYTGSVIEAVIDRNGRIESIVYTIPIEIEAAGSAYVGSSVFLSGEIACNGIKTDSWTINW